MSRPLSPNTIFARRVGISKRQVVRLGGAARLADLPVDSVKVLTNSHVYGNSHDVMRGGLRARGMRPGKRQEVIQPSRFELQVEREIQRQLEARGLA